MCTALNLRPKACSSTHSFCKICVAFLKRQTSAVCLVSKNSVWTLSVKFLNAKPGDSAVKGFRVSAFSTWLLKRSPSLHPSNSLPTTYPQEMSSGQKRGLKKNVYRKTNSSRTGAWYARTTWCIHPISVSQMQTKKIKDLLYGVTGLSILQPWSQVKRRGPGPLGASEGPAACFRVFLGYRCCFCCFWLYCCW